LAVLGLLTPAVGFETDGELWYPLTALEAVPALGSFLRILRSPEALAGPDDLAGPEDLVEPLSGLLIVCGFAEVPDAWPWVFPVASGFRIVRGLVGDVPRASRPIRLSWVSPVERSSFRRRTRFPSSG
jgi:hypothetical protein